MSTTTPAPLAATTSTAPRPLIAAGLAVLVAAATAIYGAYGDPHPSTEQEHGVPLIIGAGIVVAALLFGLLAPWAARTPSRAGGWGLALSLVGLIAIPVVFWSGLVIVVAGAGALLGRTARPSSGPAKAATIIGIIAMALSTILVVLGNTVLA